MFATFKLLSRRLLFFWELPQLLLGSVFFLILRKRIREKLNYKDSKIYLVSGFPGGISLSYLIFLNPQAGQDQRYIKHEYGHTIQSLILGWLYLPVIGIVSAIRAAFWNRFKLEAAGYYKKFPENWADRLGGI